VARRAAARPAPAHNHALLLALGALALLVLVAVSIWLQRFANELHRETTGSAA
jgi:hypothetical protein